jgi:hypothetical protein
MINVLPPNPFICWCDAAFETLFELRKHHEFLCPLTMSRMLNEMNESIERMKDERVAQNKSDLCAWEEEKRRGHPNM